MPDVMQELQEIRTLARDFARAELRPQVEKWDHERAHGVDTFTQVAELGFFGMLIGEAHGGMGFDLPTYAAALEEIAWGEPGVALIVAQSALAAQLIQQHGSDALKQQWLEKLATGQVQPAFALAEEDAGADLNGIVTRATRQDDQWRITGSKAWVTNGERAQLLLVLAAVEGGYGLFAVPRQAGVSTGDRVKTLGLLPVDLRSLQISATVPASALLVGPGTMPAVLRAWDELARLSIAAISLGIAQGALDHALGYADIREQFRTRLRHFEGLQHKIADMGIRTEAARALLQRATAEQDRRITAMAKVFASETAMWVTTQAVQVFGGYGYMRDYPVEKLMRDAKAMEMLEGANEILRVAIAESYYGDNE